MKKTLISQGWQYIAPDHIGLADVDLPNDYSITQPRHPYAQGGPSNGYFPGGIGQYFKTMTFGNAKHYLLDVDGAYMLTQVSMNGHHEISMHPHGYTPYLTDLSHDVKRGQENVLSITTNGLQTSTRWYAGAGIYRDVHLWEGGEIRLEPWDTFVTTPSLDKVNVAYDVTADREGEVVVRSEIVDADGNSVASQENKLTVKKGKNYLRVDFTLENATPWEIYDAYLYTLKSTILEGGEVLDEGEERFGIRTLTVDAVNGLRINGKETKLRGGCIHHDHGVLGCADYPAACRRKLTKLKEAGFNALRIAHNPPSELLMSLCDEMGIIVMDEAFDCWNWSKGGQLNYHRWFREWWERDVEYMVKRDRRHPSVIAFSTGNEIPESVGSKEGDEWSARIAAKIRGLDPSRIVTGCTWGMPSNTDSRSWEERTAAYFAPYDICGYNYMYERYAADHERFPNRVIWGSETHALNFAKSWKTVMDNSYVIGDFTWTAYDNLGEAGTGASMWAREGHIPGIRLFEYPWRSCYQGDLDLCGYRRPQSYFREAVWLGNAEPRIFTTHPEHYGEAFSGTGWHWYDVLDSWTFGDEYLGKPVKCEVYTDADEIEFILNGKSLGRVKPELAIATMDVNYERGELVSVAYKGGVEVGRSKLATVGAPAKLVLTPETTELDADGRDLCYIDVFVTDENGARIPDSKVELTCEVEGGELAGFASGDPKNEDRYGSNICHAFEGRAIAIVRTKSVGDVKLTVKSAGLEAGTASVSAR